MPYVQNLRNRENCEIEIICQIGSTLTNGFDLVFDDECWKTEEEFEAIATATTNTPSKRDIYREICAVN